MQATTGTLAPLSLLAGDAVVRDGRATRMPRDAIDGLIDTLAQAVQEWRAAATWPLRLRLGRSTEKFRRITRDPRETIDTGPKPRLDTMRHLLGLTQAVGLLHASTMERLVAGRELWIHGHTPGNGRLRKEVAAHPSLNHRRRAARKSGARRVRSSAPRGQGTQRRHAPRRSVDSAARLASHQPPVMVPARSSALERPTAVRRDLNADHHQPEGATHSGIGKPPSAWCLTS